jgi:hypothetical protein
MRGTDAQGQPIRWVPRQADPPGDGRTGDLRGLPPLPPPAGDLPDLLPLLNAMRTVLIAAGLAREEEG